MLSAAMITKLSSEVIDCVKLSVSVAMQNHNLETQARLYLPVELWGAIWRQLSTRERIAVSHVSRDWRQAALASPHLWSSARFVSAAHDKDCTCRACRDAKDSLPCRDCGRMPHSGPDPVLLVNEFLSRSGGFPVDLDVAIYDSAASSSTREVTAALRPHGARLATLKMLADDLAAIQEFLEPFSSFSGLRTLHINYVRDTNVFLERVAPLRFPQLTTLTLSGRVMPGQDFDLQCPAVTRLKAMFNTGRHVRSLLRTCPAVQWLDLEVGSKPVEASGDEVVADVHTLLAATPIKTLHVTNAYRIDMDPIIDFFGTSRIPLFHLCSGRVEFIGSEELSRVLAGEIRDATRLEFLRLSLYAPDTEIIHERTIVIQPEDDEVPIQRICGRVFDKLHISCITHLTHLRVHHSVWRLLLTPPERENEVLPVTTAVVDFDGTCSIGKWLQEIIDTSSINRRILRHLDHLHMHGQGGSVLFNIDGEAVVSIMREALGIPSLLQSLHVKSVAISAEAEVRLREVAVDVQLISCTEYKPPEPIPEPEPVLVSPSRSFEEPIEELVTEHTPVEEPVAEPVPQNPPAEPVAADSLL
ncbi:hypothetical protein BKA62DRAFT_702520 [Auriculariales sp. MPI-PUGE-AT-0066]|nr:hypothetical protein BKA62DRAFT_702520 [Auriculariales sp. MPI-PUGE-AT-0066]